MSMAVWIRLNLAQFGYRREVREVALKLAACDISHVEKICFQSLAVAA
jgi:hypothetical protein